MRTNFAGIIILMIYHENRDPGSGATKKTYSYSNDKNRLLIPYYLFMSE